MKKIILILILICSGFTTTLPAQEKGSTSPVVAVTAEAKAKLKTVRTIAIFLSGNDIFLARILEDALAIHLTNAGFTIVNRELLEKNVGDQVTKKKMEKAEGTINALEIGMAVNADSILTGMILVEHGEEKLLLIKFASFQLVDVEGGKTLINVLFESDEGKSPSETAEAFSYILKQNMK